MKKKIIITTILLSISVIVAIVGICIKNNIEKYNYHIEEITSIDYMKICENNKFGVINKNGDVIVRPIYDEIDIPNPSKPLFICMYNYNEEKQQYNIKVLNEKSEQILYQYVIVEAIKLNGSTSKIPYEKSVLKYMKNGKYGLIDFQGNIIVKPSYEEISALGYKEGLLLVKKNGKYGIININGATIIKEKYDLIQSDGYFESDNDYDKSGFIVGEKTKTENEYNYGYINFKGKQILQCKYNQIDRIYNINKNDDIYLVAFENGKAGFYKNNKNIIKHEYEDMAYNENNNCLIIQKNSKQGISDLNGNIIIDIQYDDIFISGKYINAQKNESVDVYDYITKNKIDIDNVVGLNQTLNDKYTIVITKQEKYKILESKDKNKDGNKEENKDQNKEKTKEENVLKEQEYDYLEYIYDDYFIASSNQKYGIVDTDGNELLSFKYDFMQKIANTKIVQALNNENNVIDLICGNEVIVSMENAHLYVNEKYINILSDSNSIYVDFDGNILNNTQLLDAQLYASNHNGKWGFINKSGEFIIQPEFDFVTEFNEYGFAGIKQNGKWGSINENGEVIIQPTYIIDSENPNFVGKYYEYNIGYGLEYYICQ